MDERPVAARMQGRAFVPLFFIFCLFYRKEIVFIFGRQGFGKEDAGDAKGTAGKETAGDLGQSGTGGQKIIISRMWRPRMAVASKWRLAVLSLS